jgi:hypothetical protein
VTWWNTGLDTALHRWRERRARERQYPMGAGLDEIFGPARKHVRERMEWVAVAKIDDRVSGDDPIVDLGTGTVTMPTRDIGDDR